LIAAREDGQLEVREARSGKEVLTARLFAKQEQNKEDQIQGKTERDKKPEQSGIDKNKGEEQAASDGEGPPKDVLLHIVASPDGNWLAAAGKDGTIYVWDIQNVWNKHDAKISFGKPPFKCKPEIPASAGGKTATLTGAGAIQSMTFSPEGNLLASAGQDNAIRLWEWKKEGKDTRCKELLLHPIPGHEGTINALVFNTEPQRKLLRLASADSKGTTKIWHLSRVQKLYELQGRINGLIEKLGAANSANVGMEPLLTEVRQFIRR